jgi:hypothetical protein
VDLGGPANGVHSGVVDYPDFIDVQTYLKERIRES